MNGSNIIGQPLEPYVGEQIKKRQEIYGSGTPGNSRSIEEISYLNSRTAWVKLASGVKLNKKRLDLLKKNGNELVGSEEGLALAKNNVLFGGLSRQQGDKLIERSGITGTDKAYGVGGTDFGFSPMPGIVDASINCLNNGSLKKATINIKAHNKNQFDVIDALYMRLGYTVLLEWGNDKYFTNPPNSSLTPMGPTLVETQFFDSKHNETSYAYWLPEIERLRKEKSGNYDALFGIVSNFNWTFEPDGTYTIQVMLYTMGDVMESFKMKVPVPSKITIKDPPQFVSPVPTATGVSTAPVSGVLLPDTTSTAQVEKLQESKIHYLLFQIQKISEEKKDKLRKKLRFTLFRIGQAGTDILDMGKILNKNEEIKNEILKLGLATSDTTDIVSTNISMTDKEGKNAYYIRLGTFLDYVQNQVFMKIIQKDDFISYLQIDTDTKNNIMYTIPNQLSTNPKVCIIKNESFDLTGGERIRYWDGLEDFVGEVGEVNYLW